MQRNPDHAYQDPRVTRHVNDGRAFLQSTDRQYDLILFALPDSLALVNGASQIRLESFLFTDGRWRWPATHLKPGGAFAMYNYYRENWLIDRLAGTAATVFGHTPCVDSFAGRQAVVTVARDPAFQQCATAYKPSGPVIAPATDDRPFLYFKGEGFPQHVPVGDRRHPAGLRGHDAGARRAVPDDAALRRPVLHGRRLPAAGDQERRDVRAALRDDLAGQRTGVRRCAGGGPGRGRDERRVRTPPLPVVFLGVAASLALAYVVQPDWLLSLPFVPRLVVAVVLAFLPIYVANIAFAKRFAQADDGRATPARPSR